ncbi:MAG: hypothetical protein PVH40_06675 [Gemmatimonadales bacterium]
MVDVILGSLLFGGGTLFLLAISPVGRALAFRIRRGGPEGADATLRRLQDAQLALLDEVDSVRREVAELQERLEFTERMLLRQSEPEQLGKARE